MIDFTQREDLYEYKKPEKRQRTKERLMEIKAMGMTEVGVAAFGVPGVMSGLYIEKVWHLSDEDWKDYMEWAKRLIETKKL